LLFYNRSTLFVIKQTGTCLA